MHALFLDPLRSRLGRRVHRPCPLDDSPASRGSGHSVSWARWGCYLSGVDPVNPATCVFRVFHRGREVHTGQQQNHAKSISFQSQEKIRDENLTSHNYLPYLLEGSLSTYLEALFGAKMIQLPTSCLLTCGASISSTWQHSRFLLTFCLTGIPTMPSLRCILKSKRVQHPGPRQKGKMKTETFSEI